MRSFFLSYFRQKVGYHFLIIRVAQLLSSQCFFFCHPVFSFLSFQCLPLSSQFVTLGSRNFDNWILWSSPLLYERCTFEGKSTKNGVIPVLFFCHPVFSFLSSQCSPLSSQCVTLGSRCKNVCKLCNWQGILGTYVKNNFYDEIGWISLSRTGMTPCLTERSCSSVADTGITPFLYFCLQR
ncbi:hypothetical protein NOX90_00810 [Wolbachia endosymbiont of Anurida maritima]|uniref:hypothetical protein n=1 Tax=Wolbachia endosymbiont of Anurida maritima TaxID=2850562 RepID=UPI0039794CC2